MMNDTILKCLLVEVGKAIAEVECTAPRHEIVRVLDEASRSIAELGVSKRKIPMSVKPEPVKPMKPLQETKPSKCSRYIKHTVSQPDEILLVLAETNPDNSDFSVRDWLEMNKPFFDDYYKGVSNQAASLSSVFSQLVRKKFLVRHDNGQKYAGSPTYQLTVKGIAEARRLLGMKHLMSDAYKNYFDGDSHAHSH